MELSPEDPAGNTIRGLSLISGIIDTWIPGLMALWDFETVRHRSAGKPQLGWRLSLDMNSRQTAALPPVLRVPFHVLNLRIAISV